jgi:hypothetical protein
MVWQASRAVRIPICGMGGIPSAFQVGAALLVLNRRRQRSRTGD